MARHLFVCTNDRSSGKPACGRRGGDAVIAAVQHALLARGGDAARAALVTPCGCLGPCFDGPNAVLYPDGVWYAELNREDGRALADHLVDGTPYPAKISRRPGLPSTPANDDVVNDDHPDTITDEST
ncbi:MAG TPA: (2Fe-2S) ferredoxin domain-containing protein [Kofleriaceae bacterium]|nr:(2Fe-2S) ferredoxin domain-containing protein [Kofleriaceae bacterium]